MNIKFFVLLIIFFSVSCFIFNDHYANAVIQLDNITNSTFNITNSGDLTLPITIGTHSNKVLVVGITIYAAAANPDNSTVRYVLINGNNFTRITVVQNAAGASELWYIVNPPTGLQTITARIAMNGNNPYGIGAYSLYNVKQTGTIGVISRNQSLAISTPMNILTPTNTDAWLIQIHEQLAYPQSPSDTLAYKMQSIGGASAYHSSQYKTLPVINSPNKMKWDNTGNWNDVAFELIPSPSGVPSVVDNGEMIASSDQIVFGEGFVFNNNINGVCLTQEDLTGNNILLQTKIFSPKFCFTDGQYTIPYTFYQSWNTNSSFRIIPTFDGPVNCLQGNNCIASVGVSKDSSGNVIVGNSSNNNGQSSNVSGSLTWKFFRSLNFKQLFGLVLIKPTPFDLNCNIVNGTFNQVNHWFSFHNATFANVTAHVPVNDNAYFACYQNHNNTLILSGRSPGNQTSISMSAASLNVGLTGLIGVPSAIFGLVLLASLANTRTGPIYVVIILAVAGIMGVIGILTFDPKLWGAMIVAGFLGLFVGRKLF